MFWASLEEAGEAARDSEEPADQVDPVARHELVLFELTGRPTPFATPSLN